MIGHKSKNAKDKTRGQSLLDSSNDAFGTRQNGSISMLLQLINHPNTPARLMNGDETIKPSHRNRNIQNTIKIDENIQPNRVGFQGRGSKVYKHDNDNNLPKGATHLKWKVQQSKTVWTFATKPLSSQTSNTTLSHMDSNQHTHGATHKTFDAGSTRLNQDSGSTRSFGKKGAKVTITMWKESMNIRGNQ